MELRVEETNLTYGYGIIIPFHVVIQIIIQKIISAASLPVFIVLSIRFWIMTSLLLSTIIETIFEGTKLCLAQN